MSSYGIIVTFSLFLNQVYADGTYFTSTGGASNYLCVTTDPQWSDVTAGLRNYHR